VTTDSASRAKERLRYYREAGDGVVRFCIEQLNMTPDPWQADAMIAYQTGKKRTAMRACKNPGKTAVLAGIGWHFLACFPHPNVVATSITAANLRDGLWKEMAVWQQRSAWLRQEFEWTAERIFLKQSPATWWMSARQWSKRADPQVQANTLAGIHNDYILFLLDETGDYPRAVMSAADAALGSGIVSRLVQAGNPTRLDSPLYDACSTQRDLYNVIEITGDPDDPKRAPRVDLAWAREQIKMYGRESPWVLVNVFGKFPAASINSLLGIEDVQEAMNRTATEDAYKWAQRRLGIDVARFGDDLTVFFPRQGIVSFKPVPMSHPRGSNPSVDIASRAAMAQMRFKHELEFYDDTVGWAHGAIDIRRSTGANVIAVAYDRPCFDPRYHNMRAYIWLTGANWVKTTGILPNVPELVGELTTPTYSFHQGKFLLEPKDEIKKRLGRSPNYADALFNTFAIPDAPGETGDMAAQILRQLGVDNRRHASTDFDPFREREQEQRESAAMEFDPFDRLAACCEPAVRREDHGRAQHRIAAREGRRAHRDRSALRGMRRGARSRSHLSRRSLSHRRAMAVRGVHAGNENARRVAVKDGRLGGHAMVSFVVVYSMGSSSSAPMTMINGMSQPRRCACSDPMSTLPLVAAVALFLNILRLNGLAPILRRVRVSAVLQRESFADVIDEALPLLHRHWREVSHYPDIPLEVNRAGYAALCASNLLRIYTARENGKLVGYAVYVVGKNAHYHGSPNQAKQDVFYVDSNRRGVMLGIRLVRFADEMMRAEGVQVVYQHVKLAHPALGRILERAGYEPIETIYGRRLDKNSPQRAAAIGGEDANARAADDLDETDVRHVASETCH
jgi:phage terminase large subunit